jgi:hypothetical protein
LNDNRDGTFTVKGSYANKAAGIRWGGKIVKEAPPKVISQIPLKSGSPPPPAQLPPHVMREAGISQAPQMQLESRRKETYIPPPAIPLDGSRTTRATATMTSSALISKGQPTGQEDLLQMEDWELAPGRIRESAGNGESKFSFLSIQSLHCVVSRAHQLTTRCTLSPGIAFSKAFLSSSRPVHVCDDVSAHVDTIPMGGTLRLDPEPGKMRLCSVAKGKVRVAIGQEPEIVIGPHGLFKVKPGVSCVVRNHMDLDAVLHIMVLEGY